MEANISLSDLSGNTVAGVSVAAERVASLNPFNIKQGEIKMADVDSTVLAEGQASIRHDIGLAASNVRGDISATGQRLEKAVGDNRFSIAAEAGHIREQIGMEACGINQKIGDARREAASETADIRYDLATRAGDIRREGAEHAAEVLKETVKSEAAVRSDIKDARYDLYAQIDRGFDRTTADIENAKDTLLDRSWSLNRDIIDTRTQVQTGFVGVTKDTEIAALKVQLDAGKNTQLLSDKIEADGDRTRALINDLKYHDLNRSMVERNAELVECEHDRREWRHRAEQNQFAGQWAALQSQIQAFASQLQETRQGMVNFGTMAGVGQSSTSNNVR